MTPKELAIYIALLIVPFFLPWSLMYLIVAPTLIYVTYRLLPKPRLRPRAMSVYSELMAQGGIKLAKMPDPIINIAAFFQQLPELGLLKEVVHSELLKYLRMRSIPVPGKGCWEWKEVDKDYDYSTHFFTHSVSTRAELNAKMDEISLSELKNKFAPRWEFHLFSCGEGEQCVLFRLDHGVGDGISLAQVLLSIFRDAEGNPIQQGDPFQRAGGKASGLTVKKVLGFVKAFFEVIALGVSPYDTPIAINNPSGAKIAFNGRRKTVYFPKLPLSWIKELKTAAGVTVNDVLMAGTAGAIERYCKERNDPKISGEGPIQYRVLLPFSFPRKKLEGDALYQRGLRNLWSFVSCPFPIKVGNPMGRVKKMQQTTNKLKEAPNAIIQMGLQTILAPLLGIAGMQKIAFDLFSRHSLVFSNVPGPTFPMYLANQKLTECQMLFPNLIHQIGIISYNDEVFMNASVDEQYATHAEDLPRLFIEELSDLSRACNVKIPEVLGGKTSS